MSFDGRGLQALTPSALPGLKKQRAATEAKLSKVEAQIAENERKQQTASDKQKPQLLAQHQSLVKQRAALQAQLDANPVDDSGALDPGRAENVRQAKKERLKRALLRGPVLLNTEHSSHFVHVLKTTGHCQDGLESSADHGGAGRFAGVLVCEPAELRDNAY
jgi:hypothetical protein